MSYNSTHPKSGNKTFSYNQSIEETMIVLFTMYSEKDRRLYAAAEALKVGYGGISYISKLLNCDRKTISKGIRELDCLEIIEKDRIRKKGGGRKPSLESIPDLDIFF